MIIDACLENNTENGSDAPSGFFYFFPFWFLTLFICSVGYLFVLYSLSCYECLRWFYLNMELSDAGPDRFLPNLLFSYKFYPCFIVVLVYISSTFTIWLCIVSLIAAVLLSYTNSFLTRNCHSYRKIVQYEPVKYQIYPLSPLSRHRLSLVRRKVMVLDLDETLIHSHHETGSPGGRPVAPRPTTPPDFILKVTIDRNPVRFFVHKRPHVDFFLDIVSQWYELVVFTASMEIYGAGVADKLDNNRGILRRRYYRQHCTPDLGSYTKDLSAISTDLSNVFILDNSPGAYRAYPDNAIPIKSWFTDPTDTALLNLLPMLDALRFTQDVRSVLSRNLHLHKVW